MSSRKIIFCCFFQVIKPVYNPPPPSPSSSYISCLMSFNAFSSFFYISSSIIEKVASGFLLSYETGGEILVCFLSVDAPGTVPPRAGLLSPT